MRYISRGGRMTTTEGTRRGRGGRKDRRGCGSSSSAGLAAALAALMIGGGCSGLTAPPLPRRVTSARPPCRTTDLRLGASSAVADGNSNAEGEAMRSGGVHRWAGSRFGNSALRSVQSLASSVNRAGRGMEYNLYSDDLDPRPAKGEDDDGDYFDDEFSGVKITGNTGSLIRGIVPEAQRRTAGQADADGVQQQVVQVDGNQKVVLSALASLERDMQVLDNLAGSRPQLSPLEVTLLTSSVLAAAGGPVFFPEAHRLPEVLAPAAAAFSAAIGIGAEYVGRVAVADGKEIAAATIQCAAEAEGLLANAERVKAVLPLCVGVGATAAPFSLLAPVLVDTFTQSTNLQVATELYMFCPLVAVLSAATAALALQETRAYCSRAISIGNRRFAKSGLVGRTWLSSTEQIEKSSRRTTDRWKSFVVSVIPAPILGALVPAALPAKAIVVTVLAAAQSAYYLTQAEYTLARATDAVALKARSAAVADTYANQGARSAAILPFTSALSALCAAVTAAIVELPWLEGLASLGGPASTASQVVLISFFPTLSALFASAASVSKARCEVDAEAASQAAATLALEYEIAGSKDEEDPVLRPFRGVVDLIQLTVSSGWKSLRKRRVVRRFLLPVWLVLRRWRSRFRRRKE